MKRLLCLILVLLMVIALPASASAAADSSDAAETLYSLGLFQGTGTDADGNPVFTLGREATRAEALVMLIRLLGKEDEALSCSCSHPFTDVPAWVDRYVAYAYENGLTDGVSADKYGSSSKTTANMYFTFVLRALGYSDSEEINDFSYSHANEFAVSIGLADHDYTGEKYLRKDAADTSLSALSQSLKNSSVTLLDSLVSAGAVDAEAAAKIAAGAAQTAVPANSLAEGESAALVPDKNGKYSDDQILKYFPTASGMLTAVFGKGAQNRMSSISEYSGISETEFRLYSLLGDSLGTGNPVSKKIAPGKTMLNVSKDQYDYVLDDDMQILGYITRDQSTGSPVLTAWSFDYAAFREEALDNVKAHIADAGKHNLEVDIDGGGYPDPDDTEGSGEFALYPITLDGESLPADVYIDVSTSTAYIDPEEWVMSRVLKELYLPIVKKAGGGLERQLTYGSGFCPDFLDDGTSAVSLSAGREYMLFTVFDDDLNVLGYCMTDPVK